MCDKVTLGMLMAFWDHHKDANVDSGKQRIERTLYSAMLEHIFAGIEGVQQIQCMSKQQLGLKIIRCC